ncbi:MAG: beta-hexosaminidase [Lachnospiraceae bacterium]
MQKAVKYKLRLFALFICISCILFTGYLNSPAVYTTKAKKIVNQEEKLLKKVQELMEEMTLEEKVAQMILAAMPADAANIQEKFQFGGYVLFADDFEGKTPASVKKRIKGIQNVSKIPVLAAVDEEGGTVVRVSKYKQFRPFPFASPQNVYASGKWNGIVKDTRAKAKFLKKLGINTNLAPVADVAYKKTDFIYKRSFSTNAVKTAKYVKKTVNAMKDEKLVSTLKHFPGYGNNGDTHSKLINDYRDMDIFKKRDLKPFQAGIEAGCGMVMVSHNIVHCLDPERPASISPEVISYLRDVMGFEGVIVTDSLTMAGVLAYTKSPGKSAVLAVMAGNDLLCTSEYKKTYYALKKAVKNKKITEKRIDSSVRRILLMKYRHSII